MRLGDVVRLASGGPIMTVIDIVDTRYTYKCPSSPEYRVTCTWFNGTDIQEHTFEGTSLVTWEGK